MSRQVEPNPPTCDRIKSRIGGREAARELASLIEDHISDRDFMEACIKALRIRAGLIDPVPKPEKPEPIARLGATIVPFGKHIGKQFDEVPTDYLDWLCREQEEFYKTLRAYLKHPQLETHRGEYDESP